ncbi:MAG TPA: GNAT family N-acetyltransferase [Chloroflexota bacterium]|nr:GNAT family N-acetyltransferase [Chloroflexota bacterium]
MARSIKIPDVPESLETERLVIRPPRLKDVAELYAAVCESLSDLQPWMPWATDAYTLQSCEENTRSAVARFITREDLRYHFHDKSSGEVLACSGLHRIDWRVPKFEIGYWCRSSQVGRGYVTEGVTALTMMAFETLGAARVEIRCDDLNVRSAAVAERCGLGLEGILKYDSRSSTGELRSTRVYARTAQK